MRDTFMSTAPHSRAYDQSGKQSGITWDQEHAGGQPPGCRSDAQPSTQWQQNTCLDVLSGCVLAIHCWGYRDTLVAHVWVLTAWHSEPVTLRHTANNAAMSLPERYARAVGPQARNAPLLLTPLSSVGKGHLMKGPLPLMTKACLSASVEIQVSLKPDCMQQVCPLYCRSNLHFCTNRGRHLGLPHIP